MKTFNNLLKEATPGPALYSCVNDGTYSLHRADTAPDPIAHDFTNRADAELIVRLLNWAHAGGVDTLNDMWSAMCDWMPEDFDDAAHEAAVNEQFRKAEQLIKLLDGV